MSWVNDNRNVTRDYLDIDELFTRPIQMTPMPERDLYHGRSVTALEEALDSAFFNVHTNGGLFKFKDPFLCPADHLPALAVETGVSGWYTGTSEQQQRETIATSKDIHRKAGTLQGITQAIATLGIDIAVTSSSVPYRLTVLSNTLLTPELTELVTDRITRYKSERDEIYIEKVVPAEHRCFYGNASFITAGYHSKSKPRTI